ncbi:MAG: hypothetical protein F9K36_03675 [Burkholderiaceae bacterium]|nr:MAG: hypothetical protein F9K36_03675 [Burkholderiaceae bacterium]
MQVNFNVRPTVTDLAAAIRWDHLAISAAVLVFIAIAYFAVLRPQSRKIKRQLERSREVVLIAGARATMESVATALVLRGLGKPSTDSEIEVYLAKLEQNCSALGKHAGLVENLRQFIRSARAFPQVQASAVDDASFKAALSELKHSSESLTASFKRVQHELASDA